MNEPGQETGEPGQVKERKKRPMRLFEAIIDANHRAASGDKTAGLRASEHADALPVVALTCIDPRLNPLLPEVLGIGEEHFIWLRNAGNIITGPTSSTMRSLALACAIKGGKEIAIIGHTDCRVGQTSMLRLTESFNALGIPRSKLPENLVEFFGTFASERQNVLKAVEFVRHSPLIGPKVPVHGVLVDIRSGQLDWLVNGYEVLDTTVARFAEALQVRDPSLQAAFAAPETDQSAIGETRRPEAQVGEASCSSLTQWVEEVRVPEPPPKPPPVKAKAVRGKPGSIPVPPPLVIRPRPGARKKAWWE
jgi:carbonic anhydrase